MGKIINTVIVHLIVFYQKAISPFMLQSCRFTPTCSEYGRQAFLKYSFFTAFFLTFRRIIKCHPFHPGGIDELP